jgi:sigma-B regulation protein RsbU (phosphoserine phosphatase)
LYENLARQERIRHELDIARRIQLASLPNSTPLLEGMDISGVSLPAFEVGGDFYDYLNGSEKDITIIVGEVSGKALYMSKTQGIMRTLHEYSESPCDLFIRTNRMLYKFLEKGAFISAIGAKISCLERKIQLARAGHLPLIFYKGKDASFTKITPKGIVLGLANEEVFTRNIEEIELNYEEGDLLIFVTDGVLEARNNYEEEFGFERLIEISGTLVHLTSNEIRDQIVNAVKQFSLNREQFDDLTIVVVKFGKNNSINAN